MANGQPELTPAERDAVVGSLKFFDRERYHLFAYVVMNDHVHLLFSILEDHSLVQTIHSWKSFTVNRLQRERGRGGRIWQPEYFDRVMRNEREFEETINYIARNP